MIRPTITRGLLGWSNKRPGLEFYRWDDRIIPRHDSEWGDLLAIGEHFPGVEGGAVVVICLPRTATLDEIETIERGVYDALGLGEE